MSDGWLERHRASLEGAGRVLEIGCGPGEDAEALRAWGLDVVATDLAATAEVADARIRLGTRSLIYADHSSPLPFADAVFDGVVASLSLHYFSHAVIASIMREIARVLQPRGVLVFRVNATDDVEYGARGGIEIERDFRAFETDAPYGATKRFFDEAAVREVLRGGFEVVSLEHREVTRWSRPKQVWECAARKGRG